MKKLALLVGITLIVFACHTKEEQKKSGINDPINMISGDVDSTVITQGSKSPSGKVVPKMMLEDTAAKAELPCIDSTKINKEAMCTQEYKPVCGCDNVTYPNQCSAEKNGVTKFTEGECPGYKNKKTTTPSKKKKK